jgi:hypothetical protein
MVPDYRIGEKIPSFLADCMLGRLAKWLRILGYDTLYLKDISDVMLIRLARQENRVLLTRDTRLRSITNLQIIYIAHDHLAEQLIQVLKTLNLKPQPPLIFSRCLVCNTRLKNISRSKIRSNIPPYVYLRHRHFGQCPSCGRYYWMGTHYQKMQKHVKSLLKGAT